MSNRRTDGPFTVADMRLGEPYELSEGRVVACAPTGGRGSRANLIGGAVLGFDPAVTSAGVDTAISPNTATLRAPDVAVGNVPNLPGVVRVAPPLAVEYADTGQDEAELRKKIAELFAAGTKYVWVVRLAAKQPRVDVYEPGLPVRAALPGSELVAPGVLKNPVKVEALYDRDAAMEATLRSLLQRRGYESLGEVREEGREVGREEGRHSTLRAAILKVATQRGLAVSDELRAALDGCAQTVQLDAAFEAVLAGSVDGALAAVRVPAD